MVPIAHTMEKPPREEAEGAVRTKGQKLTGSSAKSTRSVCQRWPNARQWRGCMRSPQEWGQQPSGRREEWRRDGRWWLTEGRPVGDSRSAKRGSVPVKKGQERTTKVDIGQFFDFFGCLNNITFEIKSFWLNLQIFIQIFWTVFDSFRPCSTVFEHSRTFRIDHNGRIGRWPSPNDHKRKFFLSKVVFALISNN